MLCTVKSEPFDAKDWIFEIKFDGVRAVAEIKKRGVELYSRNFKSFNEKFPEIVEALKKLKVEAILDGEIVVLDKKGRSHFQLIQNYQRTGKGQLVYYVFDLLELEGHNLQKLPLVERKKWLKKLLGKDRSLIRYSDHVAEKGKLFFKRAARKQFEGMIAKRAGSPYQMRRSKDWIKIKAHQGQEVVIAGFTEPRRSRKKFGALIVGVYEKGKLQYAGHVGGGFTHALLEEVYLKLKPLITKKCPLAQTPKTNMPVTWVRPKLVCEVSFAEWTVQNILRQPIFKGLRADKKAKEVIRER